MKVVEAPEGWHFNEKFHLYQKVNDRIYVYVTPMLFGWQVQLYMRRNVSVCTLEVRTGNVGHEGFMKMIQMGQEWLDKYGDGDLDKIGEDQYCISNPDGVWFDTTKKGYWI